MSCLRVADVDAVEQYGYLLLVSAADADVGLCTDWSALPYVYACRIFKQVVNTLHRGSLNVFLLQYSNHSCRLPMGKRSTRASYSHFIERNLAMCSQAVSFSHDRLCADAVCLGIGEGGNAECAYNHFLAQTSEESIALASEVFELHWRARCLLVVVHRCFLKIN